MLTELWYIKRLQTRTQVRSTLTDEALSNEVHRFRLSEYGWYYFKADEVFIHQSLIGGSIPCSLFYSG